MQSFKAGIDKSNAGTRAIRSGYPTLEAQGLNTACYGYRAANFYRIARNWNGQWWSLILWQEGKENATRTEIQNLDRAGGLL